MEEEVIAPVEEETIVPVEEVAVEEEGALSDATVPVEEGDTIVKPVGHVVVDGMVVPDHTLTDSVNTK